MGLANVNHQELDPVAVRGIEILEANRPLEKGRSSKTAKDQRHRPLAAQAREPEWILALQVV